MAKRLPILFAICGLWWGAAHAQQEPCSEAEHLQVEGEADTLRSWDALFRSYRLYEHCRDVDAAEGYSESVARILVDHWETLPRLSELMKNDKSFRHFALSHVDATLDMRDVRRIRTNAIQRCPEGLTELCQELRKGADAAIEEDASVRKKQ